MKYTRTRMLSCSAEQKRKKVVMFAAMLALITLVILTVGWSPATITADGRVADCQTNNTRAAAISVALTGPVDDPTFEFVPRAPYSASDCEDLFGPNTAASAFQLSDDFHRRSREFKAAVNDSVRAGGVEGFSFQLPAQYKALHYLAGRPHVRTVCETGFNLGHSAFNYLTANPQVVVQSFDLGNHKYAHRMAAYLSRQFPGRFFVHFGSSAKTVPEFAKAHPEHRCDVIFVDGGHTFREATADLLNLAAMANLEPGNVIVFDDYPSKMFTSSFGQAWENICRQGYVRELMRCLFKSHNYQRGFVIGTVIRRPTGRV